MRNLVSQEAEVLVPREVVLTYTLLLLLKWPKLLHMGGKEATLHSHRLHP